MIPKDTIDFSWAGNKGSPRDSFVDNPGLWLRQEARRRANPELRAFFEERTGERKGGRGERFARG